MEGVAVLLLCPSLVWAVGVAASSCREGVVEEVEEHPFWVRLLLVHCRRLYPFLRRILFSILLQVDLEVVDQGEVAREEEALVVVAREAQQYLEVALGEVGQEAVDPEVLGALLLSLSY